MYNKYYILLKKLYLSNSWGIILKKHLLIKFNFITILILLIGVVIVPIISGSFEKSLNPINSEELKMKNSVLISNNNLKLFNTKPININEAPVVVIENPKEEYIHIFGYPLTRTAISIISHTIALGGFKLNPVIINATDDADNGKNLTVKVFLNNVEMGNATYCCDWRLHEWFWTSFSFGNYVLKVTAEDSSGAIGTTEMEVFNICII
jgi:hypothetical protein